MRRALPFAAAVAALGFATWLYAGYRYGLWPQPGFLNYVFHYDGTLRNDWSTGLPPYHWVVSKALGLLPESAVEPAVLVLWLAELAILWAAFLGICGALGAPLPVALAAGLVAIPTGLSGVGVSSTLHNYFYPTDLSFALSLAALAIGLHARWLLAGVVAGIAILVHPGVGLLCAAVVLPGLALFRGLELRRILELGVPAAVLGAPSFLQATAGQVGGSDLSTHDRYELVAIVRLPHHMLYRAFPPIEYTHTVAWLVVGAVALALLVFVARRLEARAVAITVGLVVVMALIGGLASQHGSPLALVQAQTARVTPLIVALGIAAAAAALALRLGAWAAALLVLVFLSAILVSDHVVEPLAGTRASWVDIEGTEAGLVLVALALIAIVPPLMRRLRVGAPPVLVRIGTAVAALALVAALASLLVERSDRAPVTPPDVLALQDVDTRLASVSSPGSVALTPPDQDLSRFYSHRPIVVEFGDFRFGKGDTAWVQRMQDVTENPAVLDPATGTDAPARVTLVAQSYDKVVATSKRPICKYKTPLVVARSTVQPPPWLARLYANQYYQLLEVRPGTCPT